MAEDLGLELIVHINPEGKAMDMNPFVHGSSMHTDVMKTQGLKQLLTNGFDVAFGGHEETKKSLEPKREFSHSGNENHHWVQNVSVQNFGMFTMQGRIKVKQSGIPFQIGQS